MDISGYFPYLISVHYTLATEKQFSVNKPLKRTY